MVPRTDRFWVHIRQPNYSLANSSRKPNTFYRVKSASRTSPFPAVQSIRIQPSADRSHGFRPKGRGGFPKGRSLSRSTPWCGAARRARKSRSNIIFRLLDNTKEFQTASHPSTRNVEMEPIERRGPSSRPNHKMPKYSTRPNTRNERTSSV